MKEGKAAGKTVSPDHEKERAFRDRALKTAREKAASSGRAIAGGGLAVTIANEVIASGCGMSVQTDPSLSLEEVLFSEGGARAVYTVPKEKEKYFEEIWEGFPCTKIGSVGGEKLEWKDIFSIELPKLKNAFMEGSC